MIDFPLDFLNRLNRCPNVTVLTGAGISAESGIPTFRAAQTGLWARYRPEDLATPEAFQRNPRLVWDWYAWRRDLLSRAQPNPGHFALAELEKIIPVFTLITQNVDSLHQRAGSNQVIELHGNICRIKCSVEGIVINDWDAAEELPPHCPQCGAKLRPDVVWFGESLPDKALHQALDAAENCQIFLSIGTSNLVQPAASLPFIALDHGATIVEINPEPTPLTQYCHFSFPASSGEVLPALIKALKMDIHDV